ncbi:MAG: M28 family peptidase, partial [Candidatus Neomarinimicrobiota bacterium]
VRYDRTFHDAGLPVMNITSSVGNEILAALGITATAAWTILKAGEQTAPTPVPQLEITARIALEYETSEIGNVVGYLPGVDPALREQYIVIGAHFDHLGWGGPGSGSMAPKERAVHNGADDNASGVSAVIELAQKFGVQELKRSMLFVAFDGEEQGLLGSKYFMEHSPVSVDSIILMVNLDMIGRLRDKRLMVGGTGTSPLFERVLPEFNRKYQLDLQMSAEGPGPSDHSVFYGEDIPVLFMFTGAHDDYHRPSDDWTEVDTAGMRVVAELTYDIAHYFNLRDERPLFTKAGVAADMPTRRSFRVTLGIMPGYASIVDGLAVDGIREGGPADKAGMLKGDVIITMDGKEIKNIRDYMFRLGELNPGDTVEVQVLRAGAVVDLTVEL